MSEYPSNPIIRTAGGASLFVKRYHEMADQCTCYLGHSACSTDEGGPCLDETLANFPNADQFDAVTDRLDELRDENPWELYGEHPHFAAASEAIENAWGSAKRLAPEKTSKERARLAEEHVYRVMEKFAEVGAIDTEPTYVLRSRVRKHFGTEGGFI